MEPSNESGFPDAHFIVRQRGQGIAEGTVELKYKDTPGAPDLSGELTRGTQKSALIDYHQQGGRRRFFLVYVRGEVWLFNTADAVKSVVTGECHCTALGQMEEPAFVAWLTACLTK